MNVILSKIDGFRSATKMKHLPLILSIIMLHVGSSIVLSAQTSNNDICIDGSINYSETQDSESWNTIEKTKSIIIRESENAYYLGIKSNIYTSANIYINSPESVKILHISYSLGDIEYKKSGFTFISEDSIYTWKFKDPSIRNDSIQTIIEVKQELLNFYENNKWTANTMPLGSYREVEVMISKDLLSNTKELAISFLRENQNGKREFCFFPDHVKSISGNRFIDQQLQNGNVPQIEEFEIFKQ